MAEEQQTDEARELDAHPEVRSLVMGSPDFQAWKAGVPKFELDGETMYLPTGDVPVDEDQLVYQWARTNGLIDSSTPRDEFAD